MHALPAQGEEVDSLWDFVNLGSRVVYADARLGSGGHQDVFLFDLVSLAEQQLSSASGVRLYYPWIHGTEVMYSDHQFTDVANDYYQTILMSYDLVTATERIIDDSVHRKVHPVFNEHFLLYLSDEGCGQPQDRLVVKNRATGDATLLVECGQMDGASAYAIHGSTATWVQKVAPSGMAIFLADLGAGTMEQFTGHPTYHPMFAQTDGRYLLWVDPNWQATGVFLHDLQTGDTTALDPTPYGKNRPHLRYGLVAWDDYRHAPPTATVYDVDVYVHEIASGVSRRVTSQTDRWITRYIDAGWIVYLLRDYYGDHQLYAHDLVCDGILTPDGHVIPAPP